MTKRLKVAALSFAAVVVLALAGTFGPVKHALSQGMQHFTSLAGTEQILLNYPCTVSCYITTNDVKTYVNSGGSAGPGAFTTLSASSTVSGAGFTAYFASPPAIGGTAPAAGSFTTATMTGETEFAAGTTTLTPSVDQTGVLNTAAIAGGHEYDGSAFYDSVQASARGARDVEQYEYLTATYTLVSQTGAQQALNGTTNGALGVNAGTAYRFDCSFGLTSLSASSASYGFAWGLLSSATLTAQYWQAEAQKGGTSLATEGATTTTFNSAANTALTAANTSTTGSFHAYGIIQVNHAGSVQPQISLGSASAAVVAAGSGCRLWPIGPAATVVVGNWN